MGIIGNVFNVLFGPSGNVIRETAEVFRENAEAASQRDTQLQRATIDAYRAEFLSPNKGRFDSFMDGINRLPRPALALSTIGLFVAAMANPDWFAARMHSMALVPEPLWWLMGLVVSFYFGARHQLKGQEFHLAAASALAKQVTTKAQNERGTRVVRRAKRRVSTSKQAMNSDVDATSNPALSDWAGTRRGE